MGRPGPVERGGRVARVAGLVLLWLASGCASPTVTIATDKPIEIHIDLRHDVRVHLDREVSDLLESESARGAVTTRGGDPGEGQRLRAAKLRGVVGEQVDGYLGVRSVGVSGVDRELVERVNEARRAEYEGLAATYEVPAEEIGKLAGANRIRTAEAGELVRTPDGSWVEADGAEVVVVEGEPDA